MIFANIMSGLSGFIAWLIGKIPKMTVPVFAFSDELKDIINAVWWFLPMDTIFNAFLFGLGITAFRIILAVVIRVKSFIPTMGA